MMLDKRACPASAKFLLIFTVINLLLPSNLAFNVDNKQARIHRSAPNSGFGYSIAFYHYGQENLLLVGAPFARTTQRDVQRGGQIFKCDVNQNRCAEVIFDRQGNERRLNGSRSLAIEDKSYQMFGATIATTKNGGVALGCAPHYKYFFKKLEVVEPVGTCFYAEDNFNKITEFAPCRQEPARHGHHRFGYGMCGFSAAIADEGNSRLYISGPGLWYWQGGVFSQNINNVTDRPNSPEGPAPMDNFQLGYSTAAGDFTGDGIDDIIVGAPRANGLIGQVTIYDDKLNFITNLTDPEGQRGQYFGASLAVVDLNKDGLDDLIVGSPFYTDYTTVLDVKTQEHKPQYDIGKIYVYIQSGARTFKPPIQIKGQNQWSRFGYSLAAAGDLNGDGYNDFIVGAPYDGEERQGAVYVFHGTAEGVREQYTQRIYARDVAPDFRSFGFSVAGGRDIDRNDYPDIAVGAMESSKVAILRTKPVIQVSGFVKTTRKTINLDDKICVTEFGRMPCEKLRYCLKFNGKVLPQHNNIDLKVRIQLDAKNGGVTPRAFFARKDLDKKRGVTVDRSSVSREQPDVIEQHVTLSKTREQCETFDVYVPDTIRDKISPILISVNYTYQERRPHGDGLEPAIDTTLPQSFVTELTIEKDCGDDNVCIPDLQINAQAAKDKFVIGTDDKTLIVNVTVRNQGEDSYLTQYRVEIPPGFEYGGVENYDSKHKVSCSPSESGQNKDEAQEFVCEIGNPLPANERADFGIKLTGSDVDASQEFVEVRMKVNSTNPEEGGTTRDNDIVLKVPIEVKAQLGVIGRSNPEQADFSIRNRTEGEHATFDFEVGPVVSHLYQVINRGQSPIKRATLEIYWPSFYDDGKPLLYLIDQPFVSDPTKARCTVKQAHNINSAGLAISNEHLKVHSSAIETDGGNDEGNEAGNEEVVETSVGGGRQTDNEEDDDFEDNRQPYEEEDEPEYLRRKRATKKQKHRRQLPESVRRKLREQKAGMKEAIETAKDNGVASEYRGSLNIAELNCNSLNCTQISCEIGELQAEEYVLIEIFSRLWTNTLIDHGVEEAQDVTSLAFARITSLPFAPKYTPPPQYLAVSTSVNPTDPEQMTNVPWWLYLLAILIALLILALIIYCCYRCGFFKRNRPSYERAQLNKGATEYDY